MWLKTGTKGPEWLSKNRALDESVSAGKLSGGKMENLLIICNFLCH